MVAGGGHGSAKPPRAGLVGSREAENTAATGPFGRIGDVRYKHVNSLHLNYLRVTIPLACRLPLRSSEGRSHSEEGVRVPATTVQSGPALVIRGNRRETAAPVRPCAARLRVLLVEDNPVDAMRVRQLLARAQTASFEIESVACLAVAAERLAASPCDLVLLDLDLPDSIGLDSYSTLSATIGSTPIVILCRPMDEAVGIEAVGLGAQDYVFKQAISADGLARVIRCAIERHRVVSSLRGLSLTDELTGLFNRRGFTTVAQGHLRLASRTGQQFVLVFVDVDGLKKINDDRGHHEGDLVLARTAEVLQATFRQSDLVARYGGDEFAILAVDTSGDGGAAIRRRLQANVEQINARHPSGPRLSLSIGVIGFDGRLEEPLGGLLARADQVLYADKRSRGGRGQGLGPDGSR